MYPFNAYSYVEDVGNSYMNSYNTFIFMSFTAEPILTLGTIECETWEDNWTTLTADGSPAAQFEHTILITKTGAEILTKC